MATVNLAARLLVLVLAALLAPLAESSLTNGPDPMGAAASAPLRLDGDPYRLDVRAPRLGGTERLAPPAPSGLATAASGGPEICNAVLPLGAPFRAGPPPTPTLWPSTTCDAFVYDCPASGTQAPRGRRVRESRTSGGVTRELDVVQSGGRILEVFPRHGTTPVGRYVYGRALDEVVLAELDPTATGTPTAVYPLQDELGNVTHLTDAAGAVVERYDYEGYGKFRIFDAANSPRTVSSFGWNRLFQGREYIGVIDAYDFRARTLWPEIGRFGQEDPAGTGDSLNRYQALVGRWTAILDPSGAWTVEDAVIDTPALDDAMRLARVVFTNANLGPVYRALNSGASRSFLERGTLPVLVGGATLGLGQALTEREKPSKENATVWFEDLLGNTVSRKYRYGTVVQLADQLVANAATSWEARVGLVVTLLHEQGHLDAYLGGRGKDDAPYVFDPNAPPNRRHVGFQIESALSGGGRVVYDTVYNRNVIWSFDAIDQDRLAQHKRIQAVKKRLLDLFPGLSPIGCIFDKKTRRTEYVDIDTGKVLKNPIGWAPDVAPPANR